MTRRYRATVLTSLPKALEKANNDGPQRAKCKRGGADGFGFSRSTALDRLSLIGNFQLLADASRELSEHLPGDLFDHSATELDDFSHEVDLRVNHDLRTPAGKGRYCTQHCDLGRTGVATSLNGTSSKLLVLEGGQVSGTLGDAGLDREACATAVELIQKRTSGTVLLQADSAPVPVFFEVHGPPPTLIVFGAGHISMPLVDLAHDMGLKTVVVDGRPRFATKERFPRVDELLIGIPSEIAGTLAYTSSTLVVLTAHDYKYDLPVLKTVLPTAAAYVGLLGSKRRGKAITEFLKESGMDQKLLDRLHVPTGLDIGAETAAEIALSILAEAVAVKAGRRGESLKERR